MPSAFLHKKSLLDQFKDDYKMVNPIKARRTERQWENPIVRHKREKGVQDWAKSFAGKRHYRKLTRFNAMRSEAYTEKTAWTYLEELGKLEGEESRMDAAEKILKALGCKPGTEGRWYGKDGDEVDIIDVLDNTEWAFAQKVCGQLQEARQAKKIYPKFVQINTQRDFDKYIKPALGKGADAYGLSDIEGMWWEIADGERVPASAKTMREIRDSISKRPRFIFISGAGAERGITDMSLTEYAEEMGMTVKEYLNGYDAGNWESKQNERSSEDYLQEIYDSLESAWDKSKFNLSKGYDSYYDCQCVRVSLKENPNFYSLTYVIEPGDANYVADRPASFQTVWRYPNDRGVGVGEELEFQSTDFDEFGKSVFDYFDEIQKLSARKTSFESKKSETLSYEKGNKNSRGEDAPWVIRDHKGGKVLASFAKKADAEAHLERMQRYSKNEAASRIVADNKLGKITKARLRDSTLAFYPLEDDGKNDDCIYFFKLDGNDIVTKGYQWGRDKIDYSMIAEDGYPWTVEPGRPTRDYTHTKKYAKYLLDRVRKCLDLGVVARKSESLSNRAVAIKDAIADAARATGLANKIVMSATNMPKLFIDVYQGGIMGDGINWEVTGNLSVRRFDKQAVKRAWYVDSLEELEKSFEDEFQQLKEGKFEGMGDWDLCILVAHNPLAKDTYYCYDLDGEWTPHEDNAHVFKSREAAEKAVPKFASKLQRGHLGGFAAWDPKHISIEPVATPKTLRKALHESRVKKLEGMGSPKREKMGEIVFEPVVNFKPQQYAVYEIDNDGDELEEIFSNPGHSHEYFRDAIEYDEEAEEPEYRADDLGALAHHEAFHLCEEHMSYNIKDLRDKLCTYLKNEVEKADLDYDVKALEDSPYPSLAITSKPDDGHYYLEGYLVELKPSDVRFKYQYYGHPHEEVVIVGDDAQDLDVIAKYLFAQVEPKVAEDFSLSNQEIVDAIKKADAATQSDERPFVIDIDDKGSRVDVWLKSKETGKDIWNPSWGVVTGVKKIATYDTDENGSADVVGDDPYGSAEDITAFFTKAFSDKAGAKGEEAEEPEYRADDLYDFSSIRHESLKKTLHESRVKKLEAFGRSYRENVILQILDQGNNTYSKEDLEGKTVAELEEIYSELINLADAAKHEAAEDITSRDVQAAARSAWSASGAKDFKLDTEKLDDVVRIRAMGPKGEDNIGIWWVVSLPSLSVDQYAEWGAKPYEQEPERTYDAKDLDDLEDFFLDEFKALQETLDVSKEN